MAYSRMMPVLAGFVAMAVSTASLAASPIARAGFGPDAVGFDFGSAAVNATIATDGFLTVSNGRVLNVGSVGPLSGNSYYDGADDASGIRFSFATPVSAVGTDFIANRANITLSLYDSSDLLIDSTTIDWTTLPVAGGDPYGFIGLNAGSNVIAYAIIDTPRAGNELYVDNVVYQSAAVPEPATLALFGMGTLAVAMMRRRVRG